MNEGSLSVEKWNLNLRDVFLNCEEGEYVFKSIFLGPFSDFRSAFLI
jgi:hypothetical protein